MSEILSMWMNTEHQNNVIAVLPMQHPQLSKKFLREEDMIKNEVFGNSGNVHDAIRIGIEM